MSGRAVLPVEQEEVGGALSRRERLSYLYKRRWRWAVRCLGGLFYLENRRRWAVPCLGGLFYMLFGK